jgi:hypothetical protein
MDVKTEAPATPGPAKTENPNQQPPQQKGPNPNKFQNQSAPGNNRGGGGGNFLPNKKGKNFPIKGKINGPGMNNRGPMKNEVNEIFKKWRARLVRHFFLS